eukprot:CAMPEP_0202970074 /NCGR_PEP_ID=MMETSP1396-20130829/16042_1 /ASSEMBLY_ACC=CAM_ASM_000872 /TAXON_ID= /ORGANISM="Pseudokeronopsis sp., Strain Brazil" /LENGTH=71 /DNA_ID=CAMNT_0049698325 /DNA_START=167 /DNA_END=378 /DNA_ORIENTATION=+
MQYGGGRGCDDANAVDGDGCNTECHVETGWECTFNGAFDDCVEVCGDGYSLAGTHACDDGNLRDGDGCSST